MGGRGQRDFRVGHDKEPGHRGARPGLQTGFYLSTNSTWDPADVPLGHRTIGALAARGERVGHDHTRRSRGHHCRDVLRHRASGLAGQVEETSNANNTRGSGSVRIGPDLIVSAMSVPANAAAGESLLVGDTTRNQGAGIRAIDDHAILPVSQHRAGTRPTCRSASARPARSPRRVVISVRRRLSFPPPRRLAPTTCSPAPTPPRRLPEVAENNNLRSGSVRVGADLLVSAIDGAGPWPPRAIRSACTETTKNGGGAETPRIDD